MANPLKKIGSAALSIAKFTGTAAVVIAASPVFLVYTAIQGARGKKGFWNE